MDCKIVFSDVDGTLLNSEHKMLPGTRAAIRELGRRGIPFVIVSARSPSGIYPILAENGFKCPIIAYSGGLILDEDRNVLHSLGFSQETAADVIAHIEAHSLGCTWNIFSQDTWIVRDRTDPRVVCEQNIVHTQALEGTLETLEDGAEVNKILCMCSPDKILSIEQSLKGAFPFLSIVKSSATMLEIMQAGVTKSNAVTRLCTLWNIPLENAVAFGDNYNDVEMLEAVAMPFLMGNAPDDLKKRFPHITLDCDHEGICQALNQTGLLEFNN